MSISIINIRRTVSASLAIAATIGYIALSSQAHADDFYLGGGIARASNTTANMNGGKIYGGYTFNVTPYNGFNLSQSVEGTYYQIDNSKHISNSGSVVSYKLDFGNDVFGITTRIGASYARGEMKFSDGSRDANSAWFLPTVGLGMRYNLTKNVSLTADWDRLPVTYTSSTAQKVNQNMYSLGVAYKF